jgi:7-cyano-7-deazaguanine synthase in queuosine biosynthesis
MKEEKMKKRVTLLFTGGLDSTYLLYKNMQEGNAVRCLYTNIENNRNKTLTELAAAKTIIAEMDKEFNTYIELIVNDVNVRGHSDYAMFHQVPIHLFSMIMSMAECDEVQIGYCMNDDMISYLDDLKAVYNSYSNLMAKKLPELVFPLSKTSKYTMFDDLPHVYSKLVFSCENPINHRACGYCDTCTKYEYYDKRNNISAKFQKLFPAKTIRITADMQLRSKRNHPRGILSPSISLPDKAQWLEDEEVSNEIIDNYG